MQAPSGAPKPSIFSTLAFQAFSLPGKARKAPGWSLEDEDEEEESVPAAPVLTNVMSGGVEETKQSSQQHSQEDEDEVDPLDAFMQNLDQDGVVPQETMGSAFAAGDKAAKAPVVTNNVITLEDLMKGKMRYIICQWQNGVILIRMVVFRVHYPGNKPKKEDWESETEPEDNSVGGYDEDSEDEEKLERDRIEFFKELRRKQEEMEEAQKKSERSKNVCRRRVTEIIRSL